MNGRFYLFINFRQAATLGHVGWGFKLDDADNFMFGATDHLWRHKWWDLFGWVDYLNTLPGEPTDWWSDVGSEEQMLEVMKSTRRHIWYHACKVVDVPTADPERARQAALRTGKAGWNALSNNCVQQTFEIVSAYNCDGIIPNPWTNSFQLIPRIWFDSIDGELKQLNECLKC